MRGVHPRAPNQRKRRRWRGASGRILSRCVISTASMNYSYWTFHISITGFLRWLCWGWRWLRWDCCYARGGGGGGWNHYFNLMSGFVVVVEVENKPSEKFYNNLCSIRHKKNELFVYYVNNRKKRNFRGRGLLETRLSFVWVGIWRENAAIIWLTEKIYSNSIHVLPCVGQHA